MPKTALKVGTWACTYRSGVWQVYRRLRVRCRDPETGKAMWNPLVFSKRFLSSAFKRSFSEQVCHESLVFPLCKDDLKKTKLFIKEHPDIFASFKEYRPKPLDDVYNASIKRPKGKTKKQLVAMIPSDRTFTESDIEPFLESLGLSLDGYPGWTVQFVSPDHANKRGVLQYRFADVLKF